MKIENLSIKKFKGLESLEFSPNKINLITGRNNTGKTSLLESINLLFHPTEIANFGPNYGKLIKANSRICKISADLNGSSTGLELEKLKAEEVWDDYIAYFLENYVKRIKKVFERISDKEKREALSFSWEEIEKSIRKVLENQLKNVEPSNVLISPLMVIKDGENYPYVKSKIRRFIDREKILKSLNKELDVDVKEKDLLLELMGSFNGYIPYFLHNRAPSRGFLKGTPKDSGTVNFIKNLNPRSIAEEEDDEKVAVKEDDIEDYIKEKGLFKNFKAFGLDQLVFKENKSKFGVPYSFMGDGFKTIVGILWHLLEGEYEKKVVLMEEPENHMHPGYTRELVYFLIETSQKDNTQFFITTHDRDFIESFFADNIENDERDYLEENLSIINLRDGYFQEYDYERANYHIEELLKDLRGI